MRLPVVACALLGFGAIASVLAAEPREVSSRGTAVPRGGPAAPDLPGANLPQLGLVVYDVQELLEGGYAQLVRETSEIFQEMGVETGWRRGGLGTVHGNGPVREIPVILLRDAPGRLKSNRTVLGLIPKSQPIAIWVFVDHVKQTLGPNAAADGNQLATAIGRVVAHEMVHSLAPELGHTRSGLMRHSLDKQALVGPLRPSHLECADAVRAALGLRVPAAAALPFQPRY